jgi:hypothetical protein
MRRSYPTEASLRGPGLGVLVAPAGPFLLRPYKWELCCLGDRGPAVRSGVKGVGR